MLAYFCLEKPPHLKVSKGSLPESLSSSERTLQIQYRQVTLPVETDVSDEIHYRKVLNSP